MGNTKAPVPLPHFPALHQAFLWRNWGLVSIDRLARVLQAEPGEILCAGLQIGLNEKESAANPRWEERGYMTLIRRNWHLLPYDQLLVLLGWTKEKLHDALLEDDFLWHKMGVIKPDCEPLRLRALSTEEVARTTRLRETVRRHFPEGTGKTREVPFSFVGRLNRAPAVVSNVPFGLRLAFPSNALYGDPLRDDSGSFCSDEELAAMASWGINAVWFQAILYKLFPWDRAPALSEGWEERLENLRRLIARASTHGIQIILYLNEPRCLPTAFFDQHPDLKGADLPADDCSALCTSVSAVRDFLRKACTHVFSHAPGLGGAFTISMSENLTNCYSKGLGPAWGNCCPRCEARDVADVVAEVNREIEAGIHAANPDARLIVWSWGWKAPWAAKAVELLPDRVEVMCVSELGIPTEVGGVSDVLGEYYVSRPGPGPTARALWAEARKRGLKCVGKIQINTTWECAAVPYIPVAGLVEDHLQGLQAEGVDGVMLSWTLGAFLGGNLGLLGASSEDLARQIGGAAASEIQRAWTIFGEAMAEFPPSNQVLYCAPQNFGPANLLFENPTGYRATMLGFCYDDLKGWRAIYPEEVFQKQFEKVSARWKEGVVILENLQKSGAATSPEFSELVRVASTLRCHYRSVALQVAYIRERDRPSGPRPGVLVAILQEEIALAKELLAIVKEDSLIGYEPTCHYFYTANDLMEKVINCDCLLASASRGSPTQDPTIPAGQNPKTLND